MITYTLNACDQSNDQLTLKDLVLLDMTLHGRKVDTTHWLIAKISLIKDVVNKFIKFGAIVTVIVEGLGIRLEENDTQYLKNFTERDYIRLDTLT